MTITLQAVNELIQSLESAGELSIKERKYLELAKVYADKEAESVAQALTFQKCRELSGCPAGVDLQDWVKMLAAENVALKAAFEQPQAYLSWHAIPPTWNDPLPCGEYLDVHDTDGHKNSDGTDCWPVYAKPEIENPATDRIVAGIKADGVEEFIGLLQQHVDEGDFVGDEVAVIVGAIDCGKEFFEQLREGADK
ncbi:hypothetical protein ACU60F_16330 [Klebsiella aerogenes]